MNWWTVLISTGLLLIVLTTLRFVVFWCVMGIRFWRRQWESIQKSRQAHKTKTKKNNAKDMKGFTNDKRIPRSEGGAKMKKINVDELIDLRIRVDSEMASDDTHKQVRELIDDQIERQRAGDGETVEPDPCEWCRDKRSDAFECSTYSEFEDGDDGFWETMGAINYCPKCGRELEGEA